MIIFLMSPPKCKKSLYNLQHMTIFDIVLIRLGMLACPPKVVPSVKLVVVEKERNRVYDT